MTIVAFEKEVSLAKRLFESTEVLYLTKKTSNSYEWKEKVQKNTGRRRKVQVTKAAFKGLHRFVFFTAEGHSILYPHPPMEEVSQNLPLRNQRSKVPTRAPLQKLPKFSFPLRKKPIFFQTPSEIFKRSKGPSENLFHRGVWILNGMARRACPVLKHNRVSEVCKGSKVHDFEYYGQRNYVLKWKFNLCHYKFVIYF